MYIVARNIFRFIVVILFQVLIMDNVMINGYMIPYTYILFILLMPFETPRWIQLLAGFTLGLTMDLFTGTPGMHTAATVLIAFVRPYLLDLLNCKIEIDLFYLLGIITPSLEDDYAMYKSILQD